MNQEAVTQSYKLIREIATKRHYQSFTELQEIAFRNEDVYSEDKDLFIIGQTSSGKTLIPLLLFYRYALEEASHGRRPRMLFSVPYRALAAQKQREFERFFDELRLKVAVSTAEFRENDDEIRRGMVDVAVIINEKVYKYAAQDEDFLSRYDYLVLDEVGLIGDSERGMKLDFLISFIYARRIRFARPRMVLLGTPNYNWKVYCAVFNFTSIAAETRPIPLKEHQVYYDKYNIQEVEPTLSWLKNGFYINATWYEKIRHQFGYYGSICELWPEDNRCPVDLPCRRDEHMPCPITQKPCMHYAEVMPKGLGRVRDYALYRICEHHLALGHQILIFINDREQARALCARLYQALSDVLPDGEALGAYKAKLLNTCKLEDEDLFGVMEDLNADEANRDIYYEAFSRGIGFHSAAVPNELRTFIERGLLEEGTLRIVCSTETLAFGVNSNVDVVIIADLSKPGDSGGRNIERIIRRLSANEYRNYIGRAGRLSRTRDVETACGYVYTMISQNNRDEWKTLQEEASQPLVMHSLLFDNENEYLPFYILNLFSTEGYSVDDLLDNISRIPRPSDYSPEALKKDVNHAIAYLRKQKLIYNPPIDMALDDGDRPQYRLTLLGVSLRGYIIGESDYVRIFETMRQYIGNNLIVPIDEISILYMCIYTNHAERSIRTLNFDGCFLLSDRDIYEEICSLQHESSYTLPEWLQQFGEQLGNETLSPSDRKHFRLLAALLAWMRSETPKTIYRAYGIPFALIAKFSEQLCYLLEIAESIMPYVLDQFWNRLLERKEFAGMLQEHSWDELKQQRLTELSTLYTSLFFGLDEKIWRRFMTFLEDREDGKSDELRKLYSSARLSPITARQMKKLFNRYRFIRFVVRKEPVENLTEAGFRDKTKQYIADIHGLGEPYVSFFREEFGDAWDQLR